MASNQEAFARLSAGLRSWVLTHSRQAPVLARRLSKKPATIPLLAVTVLTPVLAIFNIFVASAAPGTMYVAGVTFPFNGVWLESADGGHYWDASGSGLCRIDKDAASPTGFSENVGTCNVQAKKPTQAVVGPQNADGTYFLYAADMSSKSGGPVRLTYDPNANPNANGVGQGGIVAGSGTLLGGLNTVGFFADAGGNFKNSSVALGPCNHSQVNPVAAGPCLALYLGFERSRKIERINFVDQPVASQTIEDISKVTDIRKGVRFGIGMFHNADGTDDLYIDELGGNGVSMIHDVATCPPDTNGVGGCGATITPITTTFPAGMVVQNNPDGTGHYIYVGDSPRVGPSSVLRYDPVAGTQDLITSAVPAYNSLLNPGETVTTYQFIQGLALNPHTGDLFVGDDPTFAILVNPPLNKGHIWIVPAGSAPDCVGTPGVPCKPPTAAAPLTATVYGYGLQAPKGGVTELPDASGNLRVWASSEGTGLCRMDQVPNTGLHAINIQACDDATIGTPGQAALDPNRNADGTYFLYVTEDSVRSAGVWRFVYDPNGDGGNGSIGGQVLMAPNANIGAIRPVGAAVGPDGNLYIGGLFAADGGIRRINNPRADPRTQTVDIVAITTDKKGINGTMGMIGPDLYLPENTGFTVVKNVVGCGLSGATPCSTTPLPIGTFGLIFGAAIATDPINNVVYASVSPGGSPATIFQYDVTNNVASVYLTQGQVPAAGSADATEWCLTTCTRPLTSELLPAGGLTSFAFAAGMFVDPVTHGVLLTEDPTAGNRSQHGVAWTVPFIPPAPACTSPGVPAGCVTPVPTPTPPPPPATVNNCALTINVPSLASGMTYWLQFTAHGTGTITVNWTIPVAQSAALALYTGNPFTGLADPVSKGLQGKPIAVQNTSNTATFSISAASQPAGTYTVQFFNGSNSFAGTTATLSYVNGTTACPVPPFTNIIN